MVRCVSCGLEQAPGGSCRSCGRPLPQGSTFGFDPKSGEVNPYASPQTTGLHAPSVYGQNALAGRLTRLGAVILDGLLYLAVSLPGIVLMFAGGFGFASLIDDSAFSFGGPLAVFGLVLMVMSYLALFIYQTVILSTTGQTLGKRIVGIRIVRYDTETNPGFVKAFLLRVFVNGLIGAIPFFGIGTIYALVDILLFSGRSGGAFTI